MRILQVIHGYPMRFNAGSEVYTRTLCRALADRHEVHVFTREENPFRARQELATESDPDDNRIRLHLVNMPDSRDRYRHPDVDRRFAEVLAGTQPDIVHVGHLNHLSTDLVAVAASHGLPVVYTLHDYWLACPRGQFLQRQPTALTETWALCDGQDDRKCATHCYSRYFGGSPSDEARDQAAWTDWVARRMQHIRQITESADLFLCPSRTVLDHFHRAFGLPTSKLHYLPYGFDRTRLHGRSRLRGEPFTFGYIGTHIPAKGVHLLLEAFGQLRGECRLRIFGRSRQPETTALRRLAEALPAGAASRIEWLPEYRNEEIVPRVFDTVDAIVVPSIWRENAPLVIHEAQGARVPVITGDVGGMAELVHHEQNGLLFRHRNADDLARQMQRLVDDPLLAERLGTRGYIHHPDGLVPAIADHARDLEDIYRQLIARRRSSRVEHRPYPWRITFDTNPDDCNLHCIMCEEHSPLSTSQERRRASGSPPRRMSMELIRRIVAEGAGRGLREIIPSTMGEPLLFAGFEEMLTLCARHGVKLNLTTNGTFPRLGALAWAKRIVPVTSDVKISWNGAAKTTHEAIMGGVRWESVLDNVRTFIRVRDEHAAAGGNRCRVTLQLTFLESNVAELADIVALAASLGVDRVKGHHVWAHFDALQPLSMRRSPEAIRRWNAAVAQAVEAAETHRRANGERVLLENVFPLSDGATEDLAPGGPCPFLGQEAWVSAEGRFDPCCAPDAQRRSLGNFGKLESQTLDAVWNGTEYRQLVAGYASRSLCRGCNMRRPRGQ
jgi:glycosyltransferase involved in cell wall biosynthesis/MoaA/NifB/PqqE/SkfB family radical SAM enzyme